MFAVLQIEAFAIQARQRLEPALREGPWALMAQAGRQSRVKAASPLAARAGVEPGQSAALALARCPQLTLREDDAGARAHAARLLFFAAYALAPRVEETAPGRCTVDLRGRPPESQAACCLEAVESLRHKFLDTRVGLAPTPALAHFATALASPLKLVRAPLADLAELPLERTGIPGHLLEILAQWGLHKAGAFARLPRQAVGERLGPEGLALWDDLHGHTRRVLRESSLPTEHLSTVELEEPVERLDPLLFILRRLLDERAAQLEAAGAVAAALTLTLTLENRRQCEQAFRLPQPTRRVEVLFRMLHGRLENLSTEAAITAIALRVEPAREQPGQLGLFETTLRDPHRLTETLAQLCGTVGTGAVGSPRPADTHRPDSFRLEALPPEVTTLAERRGELRQAAGALLRRHRPPLPARVWLRDGRPVRVSTETLQDTVIEARGPWRDSGEWWERPRRWRRQEWDVQLSGGALCLLSQCPGGWHLEGVYD